MIFCSCKAISEDEVRELGARGIVRGQILIAVLGLDAPECCGRCARDVERLEAVAREGLAAPFELVPAGAHS